MKKRSRKCKDRTNEKHGLLTVIEFHDVKIINGKKQFLWKCQCSCGTNDFITTSASLSQGIRSCGCLSNNVRKNNIESRTLSKSAAGLNRIYTLYKTEARKRSLPFELSKVTFEELIFSKCHYCNSDLSNICTVYRPKLGNFDIKYNGIDRIDNDIGYTDSNCVSCCCVCNLAKRKLSYNEFLEHISKIYHNIIKS